MATSSQITRELVSETHVRQVETPELEQLTAIFGLGEERLTEISIDESIPQQCKDLVTDFAHAYFVTAKDLLPSVAQRRVTRSYSKTLSRVSSIVSQLSSGHRLSTPVTSLETSAARNVYMQELAEITTTIHVARPVAEATLELTNQQIDDILTGRTREESGLGCEMATVTPNETYAHVNLSKFRNLRRPNGEKFPSGKYYLHHLAALKEHGSRMMGTVYRPSGRGAGDQLQVSHLCHHSRCVRGDHLVIESSIDNLQRNVCRKQRIVRFSIGRRQFVFNPCPHRRTTRIRQQCILPEKLITAPRKGDRYYYFNE